MSNEKHWRIDPNVCRNPEAAKEYNRVGDETYSLQRTWVTSEGREINLLAFKAHVRRNTEGLPEEECEEIWAAYKAIHDGFLHMGRLKRDAFMSYGNVAIKDNIAIMDPVKEKVLEWYGCLHSDSEILEKLALDGLPIGPQILKKFKSKFRNQIEKLQSDYEKDWHTIGITRKRARLDQLSYMFNKVNKEFNATRGAQQLPFSKELREILTHVKREIEGDNVHLTIDGKIDINTTIQMSQSVEELYSNINFISLLIGRVAARTKINPMLLHYYLFNGWYSRFSGVIKNQKMFDENPVYPSSIVMNWDTLREKHAEKQANIEEMIRDKRVMDVTPVEGQRKKTLKELMQAKVKSLDDTKVSLTKV